MFAVRCTAAALIVTALVTVPEVTETSAAPATSSAQVAASASTVVDSSVAPRAAPPAPRIVTPAVPTDPVRVTGLAPGTAARIAAAPAAGDILTVTVDRGRELPPVFGRVAPADGAVEFRPVLPFVPGIPYRVAFRFEGTAIEARFRIAPVRPLETASVLEVLPGGDRLPENLLRFYVHFSEPMQGGDAAAHVRLEDDTGTRIEQAFVETTPELWDPSMRRLTLLLHPGRIKQGLAMHDRAGAPLVEGRAYRLVIDAGMRTATGGLTGRPFTKVFRAVAADRTSPDPAAWTLDPPAAGSTDPLRITLNEVVDVAQASRFVLVEREDGSLVSAWVESADGGTVLLFRPAEPWKPGRYAVAVRPELEDLSGNRIDRLFDVPAGDATGPALPRRIEFRTGD